MSGGREPSRVGAGQEVPPLSVARPLGAGGWPLVWPGSPGGLVERARELAGDPGAGMWAVVLPCIPAMVPVARAFTRGLLGGHPRAADAELVVSEYAANAVRYGTWGSGGVMSVVVAAAVAGVRVEVADHGPDDRMRAPLAGDAGVVAEAEVAEDEGGRGLVIVDAVAERWGHYGVGGGSLTAWAELGQWDAPDVAGSAWTGSPAWIGV